MNQAVERNTNLNIGNQIFKSKNPNQLDQEIAQIEKNISQLEKEILSKSNEITDFQEEINRLEGVSLWSNYEHLSSEEIIKSINQDVYNSEARKPRYPVSNWSEK